MQASTRKAARSGGSSSRSHKDGGGDVRVPTSAGATRAETDGKEQLIVTGDQPPWGRGVHDY